MELPRWKDCHHQLNSCSSSCAFLQSATHTTMYWQHLEQAGSVRGRLHEYTCTAAILAQLAVLQVISTSHSARSGRVGDRKGMRVAAGTAIVSH